MPGHPCVASVSAFCELRYPVNKSNRALRAGTNTAHFAIAPLKFGAYASQTEATSLVNIQTSISPPPASELSKETSHAPLPKWLQEASNSHKSFKPPTLTRDRSTDLPSHIAYSNKDLDRLVCSVSQDEFTAERVSVIHQWLLGVNHAFDSRLCTTFITAFVRIRQPAAALSIFFWMVGEVEKGRPELAPTVHTYTAGIQAATAARVFSQASIIWKHAQGARIRGDEQLSCTYMAALFQAASYSQVLQLFDSLHNRAKTAPAQAYVLAIRAHTKLGESCKALELWDEMQEKLKPNLTGYGYSAAISACAHARDPQLAHEIFTKMIRSGIQPDCVSCTSLMHAYASTGAWRAAEGLLGKMQQFGVQPRAQTYTGLMGAYGAAGELGRGVALWRAMRSPGWGGPAADAHVLAVLLKAVGRGDVSQGVPVQLAEALFSEVIAETPSASPASPAAEPLPQVTASGAPEAVLANTWSQRTEKGFHAAAAVFSSNSTKAPVWNGALLDAAALDERGRSDVVVLGNVSGHTGAKWAWNSAQGHVSPAPVSSATVAVDTSAAAEGQQALTGVAASVHQSDQLVSLQSAGAAAAGDSARAAVESREERLGAEEAEVLVRELTRQAWGSGRAPEGSKVINDAVCVALMLTYSRSACWRECAAVIGRARDLGVSPTSQMYNVAMYAAACAKQPHVAEALFDSISGESWRVSWETLVFAYSRCGMHAEAEAAVAQMQASSIPLRDYVAVALIQAYSEAGQWRLALRIQQRLRRLEIKPTVHVLNALLTVCVRYHVYDRGVKLLTEFRIRGSPNRTRVTEVLARAVCQEEVNTIETQQVLATALSGIAAAVGGALIRSGLF